MHEHKIECLFEDLFSELEKSRQLFGETRRLKKQQEEINFDWKTENAIIRTDLRQWASKASTSVIEAYLSVE